HARPESSGTRRERERERGPRTPGTRPEPVPLRRPQFERRLEDAVVIRPDQSNSPPPALPAVPALDGHELLVARRVPAPDADGRAVPVGDEGEAEGGAHRLRPGLIDGCRVEEQAALV